MKSCKNDEGAKLCFTDTCDPLAKERLICSRISEMIVPNSTIPERFSRHIRENIKLNEEEAFFDRLSTFTGWNWSMKSCRVTPPRCASYGWIVVDKDLMQCCTCQKFLSAQLPPIWNKSYDEAVNSLEKSLKDSHATFCPWPLFPSPENFLSNKLLQTETTILEFGDHLTALNSVGEFLPRISPDIPETLRVDEMDLKRLSNLVHIYDRLRFEALVIALCGWKLIKDSISSKRICCGHCLRKTELSLYEPAEKSSENGKSHADIVSSTDDVAGDSTATPDARNSEIESPIVKKLRKWEFHPFHPLEEHRKWCPWVTGNDSDPISSPGWQRLLNVLRLRVELPHSAVDNEALTALRKRILAMKKIAKEWTVDPKTRKSVSASK